MRIVPLLNGDTNIDKKLNIIDMIHIIGSIGKTNSILDLYCLFRFDTNMDEQINISDAEFLTNLFFYL